MENMDQVSEQSTPTMDETQQAPETAAEEKKDEQTEQDAPEGTEGAAAHEDSEPDFQALGNMSAGDQLVYLRQHGYLDHDTDEKKLDSEQKGEPAGQAKEAPAGSPLKAAGNCGAKVWIHSCRSGFISVR